MSNKIKYRPERNGDYIETETDFMHIELPNGSQFRLYFDFKRGALEVQKSWATDSDSSITINPGVTNVIYIK